MRAPFELSTSQPHSTTQSSGGGLAVLRLVGVLTLYWCYVALSNVLYASSMQATLEEQHVFATWPARMLQHLVLYPFLVGCVWTSLRIGWRPLWRAVPAQILLCLGFSILARPALGLGEWISGPESHAMWIVGQPDAHGAMSYITGTALSNWIASVLSFELTYGFGLALITGLSWYQRYRDSQIRFSALERSLAGTRLAALRMQLSPHTLFNLLHTIRGQIGWDPSSAQTMVVQLGDVLRRLLAAGERDFSRLSDEFEFARLYLDLQRSRFSDRLSFEIVDAQLPNVWIPSLILQPLVENAVVHGLAGHNGAVHVRLEGGLEQRAGDQKVSDQTLILRVSNTIAPGASAGPQGIGLRNVRERLSLHFGDAATFRAGAAQPDQWLAELRVPLVHDA
jgi:hypothetical protein